jgi:hypothetical protein
VPIRPENQSTRNERTKMLAGTFMSRFMDLHSVPFQQLTGMQLIV